MLCRRQSRHCFWRKSITSRRRSIAIYGVRKRNAYMKAKISRYVFLGSRSFSNLAKVAFVGCRSSCDTRDIFSLGIFFFHFPSLFPHDLYLVPLLISNNRKGCKHLLRWVNWFPLRILFDSAFRYVRNAGLDGRVLRNCSISTLCYTGVVEA